MGCDLHGARIGQRLGGKKGGKKGGGGWGLKEEGVTGKVEG